MTKFATSAILKSNGGYRIKVAGEDKERRFGPQWSLAQIIEQLNAEGIDCRAFDLRKKT